MSIFAPGTTIEGADFLLVQESGSNAAGAPSFNFSLAADGAVKSSAPRADSRTPNWNAGDAPSSLTLMEGIRTVRPPPRPSARRSPRRGQRRDFWMEPPAHEHVCDAGCGLGPIGEIDCYCDEYCYGIGDCCNATGTQYSDGCAGSTCSTCLPPSPCCSAGSCGNSTCESCVCATNPSCCSGVWDASCSALAVEACSDACSCN